MLRPDARQRRARHGRQGQRAGPARRRQDRLGRTSSVNGRYRPRPRWSSSFAAVFPTDGPLDADRYFVLILLDEPKGTPTPPATPPAAGSPRRPSAGSIDRIAPFLGVPRRADAVPQPPWSSRPPPSERRGGRRAMSRPPVRPAAPRRRPSTPRSPASPPTAARSRPGFLFAALPGTTADGRAFIPQALSPGAAAVLAPDGRRTASAPRLVDAARRAPRLCAGRRGLLRRPADDLRRGHRHQRQDLGRRLLPPDLGRLRPSRPPAWARSASSAQPGDEPGPDRRPA